MTTDKTPATLATVKHGGCVQLGDGVKECARRACKERTGSANADCTGCGGTGYRRECNDLDCAEHGCCGYGKCYVSPTDKALSAQPSPGGQVTGVCISDDDRAVLQRLQDALPTAGINGWAKGVEVLESLLRQSLGQPSPGGQVWPFVESPAEFAERMVQALRKFDMLGAVRHVLIENPPALAARQPVDSCTESECARCRTHPDHRGEMGHAGISDFHQPLGEPVAWRNHGAAIDAKALATATEIALMWGHDRSQFVSRIQVAVIEAMRWMDGAAPAAQAVDLGPAVIPDTPEVRDILGRPNFWCSPWANVLRMRGDTIPRKAEEEQAAVIRFMLNHYLAHGAAWAETAGAELDAIRKADSQAVGK